MPVRKDAQRQYVGITWLDDEGNNPLTGDTVDIAATNPLSEAEDLDLSQKSDENKGWSYVTYPADYHGVSEVVVTDETGKSEPGTIEV